MTIFALPVILAFVINLTIASFVFLNKPHRSINRLFGLFVFAFAVWNIGEFIMIIGQTDRITALGIRLILFGIFLSPAFFLHFTLIPPRKIRLSLLRKLKLLPIYIVPVFLFLVSVLGTTIEIHRIPELDNICYYSFYIRSAVGFLGQMPAVFVYSFTWYAWGVYNLIKSLKKKRSVRERLQLKYLIGGVGLIFAIGVLVAVVRLILPAGRVFYLFGSTYTIFVSLFFSIAFFKYKLLNIRLLISRSLRYFIVSGLLLSVYILLIKNLAQASARIYGVQSSLLEGVLIVILVFLLRPFEKVVSTFLDQTFFKEYFQMRERMSSFTRELLACSDQEELANKISKFLFKKIGFPQVLFLIQDNRPVPHFKTISKIGWKKQIEFPENHPLVRLAEERKIPLEWEDVPASLKARKKVNPPFDKFVVMVPLIGESKILGLIFLSHFADQRKFSTDWLELLEIFAGQISLAILHIQAIQKAQARERELLQAEKLAALGRMVATVSHEIRNPLGVIQTSAETLLEQDQNLPETQKEILQFILDETERLNRILTDFLSFAKPQPIQKSVFELHLVVTRVVEMLQREAAHKNHTVSFEKDNQKIWVEGDLDQLHLALLNLGLNGLEAMEKEGELIFRLHSEDGYWAIIEVEDGGEGITEELQGHVFEPFFTTKEKGSGIGLAIVKRITQDHGGKIEFNSGSAGTTFRIYLPAKKVET